MLQIKLVYGIHEWTESKLYGKNQIEEMVNAEVEKLELEGMRVRDVRFQFDRITARDSVNYQASAAPYAVAVIYYDDSAKYEETPEEIDDAYHRKTMLERPKFENIPFVGDEDESEKGACHD